MFGVHSALYLGEIPFAFSDGAFFLKGNMSDQLYPSARGWRSFFLVQLYGASRLQIPSSSIQVNSMSTCWKLGSMEQGHEKTLVHVRLLFGQ
jgi:hypothetical protein